MAAMNKRAASLVAAGAAVAALGLGASQMARADDTGSGTSTPAPTTTSAAGGSAATPATPDAPGDGRGWGPGGRHGGKGMGMGLGRGADLSALATTLGVTETKLQDALSAVRDELKAARQGSSTTPSTPSTPSTPGTRPDPTAMQNELATKLAAKLGISADKVKTAMADLRASHEADEQKAFDDKLAAAVKAGTLTQAESDAVKKAAKAGVIEMHGGPR